MATINVVNWKKQNKGSVDVAAENFEAPVRKDVLHTVVRWQLAKRRAGTHMTKTKAMVSGGGKKPFKQKGTGNARQGSSRSPLLEGGGVIHGPSPRNYDFSVPKKIKKNALRSALSYLNKNEKLFVIDDMASTGKTKDLWQNVQALGLNKALVVSEDSDVNSKRAAKNLKAVKYLPVSGVNVYDLLKYDGLVISKTAMEALNSQGSGAK